VGGEHRRAGLARSGAEAVPRDAPSVVRKLEQTAAPLHSRRHDLGADPELRDPQLQGPWSRPRPEVGEARRVCFDLRPAQPERARCDTGALAPVRREEGQLARGRVGPRREPGRRQPGEDRQAADERQDE